VPSIATITGEGGSGGAIAIAAAGRVLMLEHSIYSVISPEGAAGILWRDGARARDAAMAMKITAPDLVELKIVDRIIPEPVGGAHADPQAAIAAVSDVLAEELAALSSMTPEQLRKARADRFYAIGRNGAH
jgi:acetyl-CoA carboxylase carboxyl transferase subunit alpha